MNVTYTTGAVGTGTVRLAATGDDVPSEGYYAVTVSTPPPPPYAVDVVAVDGPASLPGGQTGTFTFTVQNIGTSQDTYNLSCTPTGSLACGWFPNASLHVLASGQRDTIRVPATAGGTAGAATIQLKAVSTSHGVSDSASRGVTIAPTPRVAVVAPYGNREVRAACPVVGAGAGSAVQCGDLLYAHAFPAYRSLNKARGFSLLYNSATARPNPVLALDYTVLPGDAIPELLSVDVWSDAPNVKLNEVFFSTAGFSSAGKHVYRLVVPLDGSSITAATGARSVRFGVYQRFGGVWQYGATMYARAMVVNRAASPFGAGWWPAGVERLHLNQEQIGGAAGMGAMLELADGSTLFFDRSGTGPFVSPPGEHSTLEAISGGRYRRTLPGGRVTITYNSAGLVDSVADNNPSRNVARYFWTGSQLDSIVDPTGKKVTLGYGTSTVTVGIPGVSAAQLTRNTAGALATITDPDNFQTSFGYDGLLRMTASTARGSGTFTYKYDFLSRVDSAIAPAGSPKNFQAWQLSGAPRPGGSATGVDTQHPALPAVTDSVNFTVTQQRQLPNATMAEERAWFMVDRFAAPTRVQLPGAAMTEITRDSIGQPVRVRTTAGADVTQKWDAHGNLEYSVQRSVGRWTKRDTVRSDTTFYRYDTTWDAVKTIVSPGRGDSVRIAYDAYGRRDSVVDGRGNVTRFAYRTDGLLASITEPLPINGVNPDPYPTYYSYHPTSRNLAVVKKGSDSTVYVYDAGLASQVDSTIDPAGGITRYTYDGTKRPLAVARIGSASQTSTVSYAYNDAARIRTQTDPNGLVTTWYADTAGRPWKECRPNGTCFETLYGDGLNPTFVSRPAGASVTQQFGPGGRVEVRSTSSDTATFSYDGFGNLTTVANKYSRVLRTYDAYGRMTCERQTIRGWTDTTQKGATVWHDYDALGRRQRSYLGTTACEGTAYSTEGPAVPNEGSDVDETYLFRPAPDPVATTAANGWVPAANELRFAYDKAGNFASVTNALWGVGNNTWTYTYDAQNRPTALAVPQANGSTFMNAAWQYDALGRLDEFHQADATYDMLLWDKLGRVRAMDTPTGQVSYTYDGLGQLTREQNSITGTDEQFTYDAAGNRLTGGPWAYEYHGLNALGDPAHVGRLLRRTRTNLNPCTETQTHDGRGNLVSVAGCYPGNTLTVQQSFEYDRENRMTRSVTATSGNGPAMCGSMGMRKEERTFWYDGLGRKILMRSNNPCADDLGVTRYFWADDHVLVKTVNDTTETPSGSGTAPADWFWPTIGVSNGQAGGQGEWLFYGPGTDNVLASQAFYYASWWLPTGRRVFTKDFRGSVLAARDESGAQYSYQSAQYSAFGQSSGAAGGGVGYNGQEGAGGLVYMRNRWYDPNTGRFTQEDPSGFGGGINLYAYAANDPVTYSDPYGLSPEQGQEGDSSHKWVDACQEYSEARNIQAICERVHGPGAKPDNQCTATCLAKQWRQMEDSLHRTEHRSLKDLEKAKYIVIDHPTCYQQCGYTKMEFLNDFLNRTGNRARQPVPPAAPADALPSHLAPKRP